MIPGDVIAVSYIVQVVILFRAAVKGRVTESAGWLVALLWLLSLGKG